MQNRLFLLMLLSMILCSLPVMSQDDYYPESVPVHKNERSVTFSLATSGLGLGGSYRFKLPNFYHLGFNLEFFIARDDKEIRIFVPRFNQSYTLNDANRLFLIPANIELKKRLFANSIEDNFRPHIMLQVGGIFGMNFPKEQIVGEGPIGEVVRPDNEYRFTYNVLFGFGADITTRKNFFTTIRPQYRLVFFSDDIAGKKNHSAFEIKIEIGGQF